MIFALVVLLILLGLALFGRSKQEEEKLDQAVEAVEGIKHGVKSMLWTVLAALFIIAAFLILGVIALPGR